MEATQNWPFPESTEAYCDFRQFVAALYKLLVLQSNEVIDTSSRSNVLRIDFGLDIPLDFMLGVDALGKLEQLTQGRQLHARISQLLS